MICLRFCLEDGCHGTLRVVQTGGFHNDTRVSKLKCSKCEKTFSAVQFIGPIELIKYVRSQNSVGEKTRGMRLRHAITVDLDPHLRPEIRNHPAIPDPWE